MKIRLGDHPTVVLSETNLPSEDWRAREVLVSVAHRDASRPDLASRLLDEIFGSRDRSVYSRRDYSPGAQMCLDGLKYLLVDRASPCSVRCLRWLELGLQDLAV